MTMLAPHFSAEELTRTHTGLANTPPRDALVHLCETVKLLESARAFLGRYNGATYLENHGIVPFIDRRVAIAHNKVMVIDGRDVISGSFNFTKAAQDKNAENVLIIRDDAALARAYSDNWHRRADVSDQLDRLIEQLPFGSGPPE